MRRMVLLLVLVFLSGSALADTAWRGTSAHSLANGTGDLLAAEGAAVSLFAESTGAERFAGAITSIDAQAYRGRNVVLAGELQVQRGTGGASLWLRADGADGRLAFASSGDKPVSTGQGTQSREIHLYVPLQATSLKLGLTLGNAGQMSAGHLTLRAESTISNGVTAYDMLERAITVIEANALSASKVDWPAQRELLRAADLKRLPAQEAYGSISKILAALEDRHSSVRSPGSTSAYRADAVATRAIESGSMRGIGYLAVPGLRGTDPAASWAFSNELCDTTTNLARVAPKGWIIDLRANTGGNMWPMINGLRSFLGSGDVGGLRDREGATSPWQARSSDACSVDLSRSPVAVLIGPGTASSGEAVAVAFRARPGTRFFGQSSAGLATSNRSFDLPDGGALSVTSAVFLDRSGAAYPQGIAPENVVAGDQEVIDAALNWLRSLP